MENGPFIDEFPIKTSIYKGFSMAMLNNQMVYIIYIYIIPTLAMNRWSVSAGTDEMASLIQEDESMSPCFEGMTSTEAPDVDRV
jgi:hypothetical protein